MIDNKAITKILHRPEAIRRDVMKLDAREAALKYALLVGGISYERDRVQTSPSDKMAEVFAEIDAIRRKKQSLAADYKAAADDIMQAIDRWLDPSSPEAAVMALCFVGNVPMRDIANKLNYSCSHCYHLRDRGELLMSEMQQADAMHGESEMPGPIPTAESLI